MSKKVRSTQRAEKKPALRVLPFSPQPARAEAPGGQIGATEREAGAEGREAHDREVETVPGPRLELPNGASVQDVCADLDGKYDREALRIIYTEGIFPGGGTHVDEAIARLRGKSEIENEQRRLLQAARCVVDNSSNADERRRAFLEFEETLGEQAIRDVDAAYLLGIAIGQRLGPAALRATGGTR